MKYSIRNLSFLMLLPLAWTCFVELPPSGENETDLPVPYRLIDTGSSHRLTVNLPGVKREDLRVSVDYSNNIVEVEGRMAARQDHGRLRGENKPRQYKQRWQVEDDSVDLFELVMERRDKSLTICVPKPSEEQGRISHLGQLNHSTDDSLQPPGGAARRLNIHVCQQQSPQEFALSGDELEYWDRKM